MYPQSENNLLNGNTFFICSRNMVSVGPLTVEICWRVLGTRAYFNGFRIFVSSLHRRRLTEINQTSHGVGRLLRWCSLIIIFRGSCPLTEFCQVQYSLCVKVLRSRILAALLHGTLVASAIVCGMVQGMELRNFRRAAIT